MRRTKGLRHAALRKAQQVKQDRDARRLRHECQLEAALADYFERMALATAVEQATAAKVAAVEAAAAAEAVSANAWLLRAIARSTARRGRSGPGARIRGYARS